MDAPTPSKLAALYERNKGVAYVLLAQVFGVLMNVTTRILEMEGNNGQGFHPFQVSQGQQKRCARDGTTQHWLIPWADPLRPHDNHYDVVLPIYVVESDTALPIRSS